MSIQNRVDFFFFFYINKPTTAPTYSTSEQEMICWDLCFDSSDRKHTLWYKWPWWRYSISMFNRWAMDPSFWFVITEELHCSCKFFAAAENTLRFLSQSWNARQALYPLEDIWQHMVGCLTSLDGLYGFGKGIRPHLSRCPKWGVFFSMGYQTHCCRLSGPCTTIVESLVHIVSNKSDLPALAFVTDSVHDVYW